MFSYVYGGATLLTGVVFLVYGLLCLFSGSMVAEFQRWGLSRFRKLTGSLEVLGGIGLLVGYFFSQVLVLASSGLALLMLLGLVARFRTHDSLLESLPAGVLMITNVFLLIAALGLLPTT